MFCNLHNIVRQFETLEPNVIGLQRNVAEFQQQMTNLHQADLTKLHERLFKLDQQFLKFNYA